MLNGWAALEGGRPASVRVHPGMGLAVLRPPRPLHYYALFSHALGADTVLTVLPGQRYEVESRWVVCVWCDGGGWQGAGGRGSGAARQAQQHGVCGQS